MMRYLMPCLGFLLALPQLVCASDLVPHYCERTVLIMRSGPSHLAMCKGGERRLGLVVKLGEIDAPDDLDKCKLDFAQEFALLYPERVPVPQAGQTVRVRMYKADPGMPALPGPSVPGPSVPGPSVPSPSVPSPSVPSPSLLYLQ